MRQPCTTPYCPTPGGDASDEDVALSRASDPAAVDLAVGRIIIASALVVGVMSVVEAVRGHRAHRVRLNPC
jgi:hypothetical protein